MPMKRILTFAVVLLSFVATIPAEAQYAVGRKGDIVQLEDKKNQIIDPLRYAVEKLRMPVVSTRVAW